MLDLDTVKPKDLLGVVEAFAEAKRSGAALGPLPVKTGWNEITPAIAIDLLKRNDGNRKVDPATVIFYAQQMARDDWKKTGQPMLIDSIGRLVDAQHRCYAGLISGTTFPSYVVTDIEPIEGLFAYIDNSKVRTAATALQTAGMNGVSPTIVKMIRIAEEARLGVFNPSGPTKLQRQSPADVLHTAARYPGAQAAARSAASDWEEAVTYLGNSRKEVVAYVGMVITGLHGEEKADDFFGEIVDGDDRQQDDPIAALRKEIDRDSRSDKPMKKHHVAAALIKAFNAWYCGETLGRRWTWNPVNEDFPILVGPAEEAEAVDAAE